MRWAMGHGRQTDGVVVDALRHRCNEVRGAFSSGPESEWTWIDSFLFGFYSTSSARKKVEGQNLCWERQEERQRWTRIMAYIPILQSTLACPWCSVGSASCHKATRSPLIGLAKIREKMRGEMRRRVSAYPGQDQGNQPSTSAIFLKGGSPDRVEAGWGSCTPPR